MNMDIAKVYYEIHRKTKLRWWKPIKHGTAEGWRYECLQQLKKDEFKKAWKAYVSNKLTDIDLFYLEIGRIFTRLLSKQKMRKMKNEQ